MVDLFYCKIEFDTNDASNTFDDGNLFVILVQKYYISESWEKQTGK